jgi:putative oxidoreductase
MQRRIALGLRVIIGIMMAVVGLLKFVKPDFKVAADATLQAFIDSGWLWPLIGAAELVGGVSLASGQYVPLGLAILTPIVVGILLFAIKVGGEETSVGFILAITHGLMLWHWRASYRPLFKRTSVV